MQRDKSASRGAPWTTGEKWLLGAIVVALVGGIGIWAAFKSLETMPVLTIPPRIEPSPNGYTYFEAAGTAAVEGPGRSGKTWVTLAAAHPERWLIEPPPAAEIAADRAAGVNNTAALALVRRGLALPVTAPRHDLRPELAQMRHLARALKDSANMQAAQGQYAVAVTIALDDLAMGRRITNGSVIDLLVGDACQAIARHAIWPMRDRLDSASARQAARRLTAIDAQAIPFADILTEEKWATAGSLIETFQKPSWRAELLSGTGPNGGVDAAQARALAFVSKRALLNATLKRCDSAMALCRGPFRADLQLPSSGISYVDDSLGINSKPVWFKWCQSSAENRLLATALALRAYQMDRGRFPASLQGLVPKYLPAVPQDPFSSGALKYKLAGGVYTLYSVGPDGKDDGGKPIDNMAGSNLHFRVEANSRGDIVAGLNE